MQEKLAGETPQFFRLRRAKINGRKKYREINLLG